MMDGRRGVARRSWTFHEDRVVANTYHLPVREVGRMINRSPRAISDRRYMLTHGFNRSSSQVLQAACQQETLQYADRVGDPWTIEEDEFIQNNMTKSPVEVAIHLGRTYLSVTKRRSRFIKESA